MENIMFEAILFTGATIGYMSFNSWLERKDGKKQYKEKHDNKQHYKRRIYK